MVDKEVSTEPVEFFDPLKHKRLSILSRNPPQFET